MTTDTMMLVKLVVFLGGAASLLTAVGLAGSALPLVKAGYSRTFIIFAVLFYIAFALFCLYLLSFHFD